MIVAAFARLQFENHSDTVESETVPLECDNSFHVVPSDGFVELCAAASQQPYPYRPANRDAFFIE